MLNNTVNRVDFDISWWQNKERNIDKVFSDLAPQVKSGRNFQKARLAYYRSVRRNYSKQKSSMTPDENFSYKLLKDAMSAQWKQLYPKTYQRRFFKLVRGFKNLATRLSGSGMDVFSGAGSNVRGHYGQVLTDRYTNRFELHNTLRKSGFQQAAPELDRQLQQAVQRDLPAFTVALPLQIDGDKSVEYRLQFKKVHDNGLYDIERYDAHLLHEGRPELNRSREFRIVDGNTVSASQAVNLLEGRSFESTSTDIDGHKTRSWMHLNFNERDVDGQFKLKQFPAEKNLDLEKSFSGLPILELANPDKKRETFNKIKNGDIANVNFDDGRNRFPLQVTANPTEGDLQFYNQNMGPLTRQQLENPSQHLSSHPAQNASLTIEQPQNNQSNTHKLNNSKPRVVKAHKPKRGLGPR